MLRSALLLTAILLSPLPALAQRCPAPLAGADRLVLVTAADMASTSATLQRFTRVHAQGPWKPDGWPGNEVGWTFHPDAWGRGYATEAAVAAIDWAFAQLGWDDIIHCIDPANAASQALARRLGSRNRGPVALPAPYESAPSDAWGQTRAEWSANRERFA